VVINSNDCIARDIESVNASCIMTLSEDKYAGAMKNLSVISEAFIIQ